MSESRRYLSRPRTRVYDCNYNIGERYYRPVVDSLDKKYGAGNLTERIIADEPISRRSPLYESRPTRSTANDFDDDIDSDIVSSLQRLKSARAAKQELEDEMDALASQRSIKKRSAALNAARESILEDDLESAVFGKKKSGYFHDKLLDTVGVNGKLQKSFAEEAISSIKKKTQSAVDEFEDEIPRLTKWTALKAGSLAEELEESFDEKAAKDRARKSRARLLDLDAEMDALAERGAAREKRIQGLKALLADTSASSEEASSIHVKQHVSKTQKKVTF